MAWHDSDDRRETTARLKNTRTFGSRRQLLNDPAQGCRLGGKVTTLLPFQRTCLEPFGKTSQIEPKRTTMLTIIQSWRYPVGDTTDNCNILCSLAQKAGWTLHLYASPTTGTKDDERTSGPDTNFPLLCAMATEDFVPGVARFAIVLDGLLLTARRQPRASEVRAVLDIAMAQQPGKVRVAIGEQRRAPFTAAMDAEVAAKKLAAIPTEPLTSRNRPLFWRMLSSISEDEIFTYSR